MLNRILMGRAKTVAVALIGAVAILASGHAWAGKSSRDYEQKGLVAHWDGVENSGRFDHRPDAAKWVDLVRGIELTLPSWVTVEEKSLYSVADPKHAATVVNSIEGLSSADDVWTVEIVQQGCGWTFTDNYNNLQTAYSTPRGYLGYRYDNPNGFIYFGPNTETMCALQNWIHATAKVADVHTMTAVLGKSKDACSIWMDGVSDVVNYQGGYSAANANSFSFFRNARMDIRLYAIRFYNRALTQEEIDANHAVDVIRFVNGDYSLGGLTIAGEPSEFGAVTPAYGERRHEKGETVVCTAPSSWVSDAGDERADCLGWTLRLADGTVTSGPEVSKSIVFDESMVGATLTWQWRRQYLVCASVAGEGGTVTPEEQWVTEGESPVFSVTPAAGCRFYKFVSPQSTDDFTTDAPDVSVKQPMDFAAYFISTEPSAVEKTPAVTEGELLWDDPESWSPSGVPSATDRVTLAGTVTCHVPHLAICWSLRVGPEATLYVGGANDVEAPTLYDSSNLKDRTLDVMDDLVVEGTAVFGALDADPQTRVIVGGDMVVSNAAAVNVFAGIVEADADARTWRHYKSGGASFAIAGDLTVADSSKVTTWCHKVSGMPVVWNVSSNVTIGADARFDGSQYISDAVYAYGYGWEKANGLGFKYGCGGAYGGNGGNGNDKTYGFSYAPFYPGSPGSHNRTSEYGHGGGAVRIAAGGTIRLDGKIHVAGGSNEGNANHAGSGGSVWLTCRDFAPGPSALILARGGDSNQHGSSFAGGGGRIAIMTGAPTEQQIEDLYASGTCGDLIVASPDLSDPSRSLWPTLVNIRGGMNLQQTASPLAVAHGKPGSAVYLQNVAGKCVVTIDGDVLTTEASPSYGTMTVDRGKQTFTAPKYVYAEDGLSRYECVGWEWEDANGDSGSGETLTATVDVQSDLAFSWKWSGVQRKLTVRSGGYGEVSWNGAEWYADGDVAKLTAVPAAGCAFACWAGEFDYSNGANENAVLALTMDRPYEVVALFKGTALRTLTWNAGGTSDWFDKANWDGEAVPSELDAVVFTGGTFQVRFPYAIKVASWTQGGNTVGYVGAETVTKSATLLTDYAFAYTTPLDADDARILSLTVAGDLELTGDAKLWFGGLCSAARHDVVVGGDMTMDGRSAFELYAGLAGEATEWSTFALGGGSLQVGGDMTLTGAARFSPVAHPYSGAPIVMTVAKTAVIGENATVNANVRGYGRRFCNPGTGWNMQVYGPGTSSESTARWGGTYGGLGGLASAEWFPDGVGYLLAPFYPGSAGRCTVGAGYADGIASGGGAVRLSAHRIVLEGTITANGDGANQTAGGSGGGVWLTSRKFDLGSKGMISAKGGRSWYGETGGGGGGRISVMVRASDDQIAKLYVTGVLKGAKVLNLADQEAWTGHFDVSGGLSASDNGQPGTAVFVTAPAGFMLMVR